MEPFSSIVVSTQSSRMIIAFILLMTTSKIPCDFVNSILAFWQRERDTYVYIYTHTHTCQAFVFEGDYYGYVSGLGN